MCRSSLIYRVFTKYKKFKKIYSLELASLYYMLANMITQEGNIYINKKEYIACLFHEKDIDNW